jgi:Homeodomain-like domain
MSRAGGIPVVHGGEDVNGPVLCTNVPGCGKPVPVRPDGRLRRDRHGWCEACRTRWDNAGKPESGPPPPMWSQVSGRARQEQFQHERRQAAGMAAEGLTVDDIAACLHRNPKTVARWLLAAGIKPPWREPRATPLGEETRAMTQTLLGKAGEPVSDIRWVDHTLGDHNRDKPAKEPDVSWHNNRAPLDWEQGIIAEARRQERERDLAGLLDIPRKAA